MSGPLGVLLMAYGSPATLDDVEAYYTHIRGGRPPGPEHTERLRQRYRRIGGRSPLLDITRAQAAGVERVLGGRGMRARSYVGMKHAAPFIADTVAAMAAEGIAQAVAIALTPQYSRMSVGTYQAAATEAAAAHGIGIRCVDSWHDHPGLITGLAARVEQAARRLAGAGSGVIFTAHSLPERIRTWNDPYPDQLRETCARVAAAAGLTRWRFAYQSASHTGEAWLGPDLLEVLQDVRVLGWQEIVVCPVGFVADHLEVLYDIDVAGQERAQALGLKVERAPSLNDSDDFILVLADLAMAYAP